MAVKPLSPQEINIELPDFVLEAVNAMIRKKFRGSDFSFTAKELIAYGKNHSTNIDANKDWFAEKWMDFEKLYEKHGWDVKYEQPSYGDSDFDAYYEFTPIK